MSASGKPFNVWPIVGVLGALLIVTLLLCGVTQCSGQTPPQPPQPQFYAVPARGPLPWIRWHIFGRPTFDLYAPVGQPWQQTYQMQVIQPVGGVR